MGTHYVMRSPLNLNYNRSQCQVYTHHCSAASDCDQVANSFFLSLEGEGNSLLMLSWHRCSRGEHLFFLLSFYMIGPLIKVPSIPIPIVKDWACTLSHALHNPFFGIWELSWIKMGVSRFALMLVPQVTISYFLLPRYLTGSWFLNSLSPGCWPGFHDLT